MTATNKQKPAQGRDVQEAYLQDMQPLLKALSAVVADLEKARTPEEERRLIADGLALLDKLTPEVLAADATATALEDRLREAVIAGAASGITGVTGATKPISRQSS